MVDTLGRASADTTNPPILDHDCARVDHVAAIERHDAPTHERHRSSSARTRKLERDFPRLRLFALDVVREMARRASEVESRRVPPAGKESAFEAHLLDGELRLLLVDMRRLLPRSQPWKRRHVNVVALGEGDPLAVWRRHRLRKGKSCARDDRCRRASPRRARCALRCVAPDADLLGMKSRPSGGVVAPFWLRAKSAYGGGRGMFRA